VKRKILTYLFLTLLFPVLLLAQQPDSTREVRKMAAKDTSLAKKSAAKSTVKKQENKQGKKRSDFVDKNANGVDDRMEKRGKRGMRKGKSDVFIDRDGDGICDGRESAIGLKKIMRRRHRGKDPMN